MTKLQELGFNIGQKRFIIRLKAVIADAPARSFIKCCSNHNAYYGCERCKQKGEWYRSGIEKKGRVIFPDNQAGQSTDLDFSTFVDKHYQTNYSPLLYLGIGMVTDIPLDYMHLVCLGVARKFLHPWLKGKLPYRISSAMISNTSTRLLELAPYIPTEFARRPRSLSELDYWKATEYRQFVVYTGPIVLHGILSGEKYEHFLLLHTAMYILLSCNAQISAWNKFAQDMLQVFVHKAPSLYGKEFLIYNMHSLIHLADDARKFGPLDNISAFCFENHMQTMKRMLRKRKDRKSVV